MPEWRRLAWQDRVHLPGQGWGVTALGHKVRVWCEVGGVEGMPGPREEAGASTKGPWFPHHGLRISEY